MTEGTESAELDDTLGREIARGASWVIALRFALRTLGLVSTLILARLLTPADFGIIALATVIVGGVEMLGEFNFSVWLIRHKDPAPFQYDTVWTLGLIRSCCISLLILLLAVPVSTFYDDSRLATVLVILAFTTAFAGLENVGLVDFQKHMKFDREFIFFGAVKLGTFLITVAMAIVWRNYWALLAGIAAGSVLRVVLSYRLHSHRPKFSLRDGGAIFNFSKWLLTGSLFGFLYTRSRMLILGKMLDSQALGLFSVAQEISNMAATELLTPLRRVLLPAYSKMTDDLPGLKRTFLHTFAIILLVGLPIACGIGLVAEPLVQLALGEQWLAAVPLIQILAFYAIGSICIANQGPLLIALGHTKVVSNLYALGVLVQIPSVIVATYQFGLVGAAYAVAGIHLVLFVVCLFVTMRFITLSLKSLLASTWRIIVAVLLMAACVFLVQPGADSMHTGPALLLAYSTVTGVVSFVSAIVLLWFMSPDGALAEGTVIGFVRESITKREFSSASIRAALEKRRQSES